MLHACSVKFDVTENVKNFANFFGTKQGPDQYQSATIKE
jgi:hypothetical protein